MKINKIYTVYFSPAGSTEYVSACLSEILSNKLKVSTENINFTLPEYRMSKHDFKETDLVVFATPTYAGRVPNKILPFIQNLFCGNNTPTVTLVTYGNRNFDSSLKELTMELSKNNFRVFAAGAFVCRHVFSNRMAFGRPDEEDKKIIQLFADSTIRKLQSCETVENLTTPVFKNNNIIKDYYVPLGTDNKPAKFLKATPKTNTELCDDCGICAAVCPMGSIEKNNVNMIKGICIKCHACVLKCPKNAKYFDDPALASHIKMLEKNYSVRRNPEFFV